MILLIILVCFSILFNMYCIKEIFYFESRLEKLETVVLKKQTKIPKSMQITTPGSMRRLGPGRPG